MQYSRALFGNQWRQKLRASDYHEFTCVTFCASKAKAAAFCVDWMSHFVESYISRPKQSTRPLGVWIATPGSEIWRFVAEIRAEEQGTKHKPQLAASNWHLDTTFRNGHRFTKPYLLICFVPTNIQVMIWQWSKSVRHPNNDCTVQRRPIARIGLKVSHQCTYTSNIYPDYVSIFSPK